MNLRAHATLPQKQVVLLAFTSEALKPSRSKVVILTVKTPNLYTLNCGKVWARGGCDFHCPFPGSEENRSRPALEDVEGLEVYSENIWRFYVGVYIGDV